MSRAGQYGIRTGSRINSSAGDPASPPPSIGNKILIEGTTDIILQEGTSFYILQED